MTYFKSKRAVVIIIAAAVLSSGVFVLSSSKKVTDSASGNSLILTAKPASASAIYPMFECPCCGKPIDQCTCPMAGERQAFVEGLVSGKLSEEAAVTTYAKRYGLESFINKDKQREFREKLALEAPADRPIITIDPSSIDLGEISQSRGIATTTFTIKNEGQSDLIINKLETSCGCTSGSIIYEGQEGPRFTMPGHAENEEAEGWQVAIPPGQSAELKVYYDPNTHKDLRGAVTRTVSVFSNDPIDFEKKVAIEVNQTD